MEALLKEFKELRFRREATSAAKRRERGLLRFSLLAIGLMLLVGGRIHPETRYPNAEIGSGNIRFSHASGFYESPFYLEIKAPGREIYYTLDGSEPDRNSIRYDGPIYINDASKNENVLSAREDISSSTVIVPTEPVDKCTVIRVRYYDLLGGSETAVRSYFVGFSEKRGYEGYAVVSLIMDPKDLTDPETGIYVTGSSYTGGKWSGNYGGRGRKWEREGCFQYFDAGHTLQTSSACGVRIKGNWSRHLPQKSLSLFARKAYGGLAEFPYDFWGSDYYPDVLTLHSGGNDREGKLQNRLVSELCREEPFAVHQYVLCQVFLNGEYWGMYDLTESYTAHYIGKTYGVPERAVVSAKSTLLEIGNAEDLVEELNGFVYMADFSDGQNWKELTKMMDMDSLIRYYAVMLYCARNTDWPVDNTQLWRTASSLTGYGDGKWRYMLYDMDSPGLTADFTDHDTIQSAMDGSDFFRSLCGNETFRQQLGQAILELSETTFAPQRVRETLTRMRREQAEAMVPHFRRWFSTEPQAFYEHTDSNLQFFENRPAAIRKILGRHDMLPGES